MPFSEVTLLLFSIFIVLLVGSYLLQFIRVATDKEGAKAISYSTQSIWIGANTTAAAYAVVNISDIALFLISGMNALGGMAVVGLTAIKRYPLTDSGCRPHRGALRA